MDAYLENIEMTQKQIDAFEAKIAAISNEDTRAKLLITIPRINYVTALTIISEIVDIKRFATPERRIVCRSCSVSQVQCQDTKRRRNNKIWFCMVT